MLNMHYKQKFTIGGHVIYLADAYELMKSHSFPRVDALVADPPYEFATSGGGMFRDKRRNMDEIAEAGLDKGFDHEILNPVFRFGACVVFCHNDQLPDLLNYIKANYERFAVLSYHKTNPIPVRNKHYLPDTEFFIHAWNDGYHPVGDHEDMVRYYVGQNAKDTTIDHPTVKPLPLMEKIIKNVNGNLILDPFMGSGTTGIACMNQGKKFIGIEINEKFFNVAKERLENHYSKIGEK